MSSCPTCASPDVVGFTLAPRGEALRFTHCRACEHRWWEQAEAGAELALGEVLQHIAA